MGFDPFLVQDIAKHAQNDEVSPEKLYEMKKYLLQIVISDQENHSILPLDERVEVIAQNKKI